MPQRTRIRIEKGLYLINGIVYMERTKEGRMHRRKAPVQFTAALNRRREPTPDLRRAYREFSDAVENERFRDLKRARSDAPTPERLAEVYRSAAAAEYAKHEQPRPATVRNNVLAFLALARDIGAERTDGMTAAAVEAWVAARCVADGDGGGMERKRVSAWSTLNQAKGLWARWTAPYYERANVFLPACLGKWPVPKLSGRTSKYERPPEELRRATFAWYEGLETSEPALWLACTLMTQFAMRPVDAAALRWADFERRADGHLTLRYVPSKTRMSAERPRTVRWPVDRALHGRMAAAGAAEHVLPGADAAARYALYIREVNPKMRALGWARERWGKACYELRKMCIDAVYQRYGLERAVQISGDNPETVRDYYSDPNSDTIAPVDLAKV